MPALVRAKVDYLRAQLTGAAAQERLARALDRIALAERFAWRVRLPRLVCVTGLAASGKSTLAEALGAVAGGRCCRRTACASCGRASTRSSAPRRAARLDATLPVPRVLEGLASALDARLAGQGPVRVRRAG